MACRTPLPVHSIPPPSMATCSFAARRGRIPAPASGDGKMRSATGVYVCLLGLATLSTDGRAQQQPAATQPPRTFQSGVDVVEVDVSVLDKDRRPVRGLAQSNFIILQDGKPRPIVAFSAVDLPERDASSARASWMRDVSPDVVTNAIRPEGRLVVIMLDWSIRF